MVAIKFTNAAGMYQNGLQAYNEDTGAITARTITAPAAGITISNGNGVSGNPTLALADDLAALEAMSGTGLAIHAGASTWLERTIQAGTGVSVTNGTGVSGDPTINAVGGGFTWITVTGTSDDIEANTGYQCENVALTTLTLPASMTVNDCFYVLALGTGLVRIAQRAGQSIRLNGSVSTAGVGGYLDAMNVGASVCIKCTTADTEFCVISSNGNWDTDV